LSAMAQARLTARATARAETKVGHSDPVVPSVEGHRSTDKRYAGDNRLMTPKSPYRRSRLAPRCRSSHPGAGAGPKGMAVRHLKWYVSWVQNVVRQFGPYLPWVSETREDLSLVREDRDG